MRSSTIASLLASAAVVVAAVPQWNSSSVATPSASKVVTDMTVTDYTTYCPYSTLVTVTKCVEDLCAPTVITVTKETTLTVTGKCVVPTTKPVVPTTKPAVPASTVVKNVTVTDYTTYCPTSTVVTVTTCTNHVCAPHVTTVTKPSTITVTGECIFPSTVQAASTPAVSTPAVSKPAASKPAASKPAASKPAASKPAASSPAASSPAASSPAASKPASSSVPSVSRFVNGGNSMNALGAAGLFGAAALIL